MAVNCAVDCKEGCILGNQCPNLKYREHAERFIADTSLEQMLEIADQAVRRKLMERTAQPPRWVFPDEDPI